MLCPELQQHPVWGRQSVPSVCDWSPSLERFPLSSMDDNLHSKGTKLPLISPFLVPAPLHAKILFWLVQLVMRVCLPDDSICSTHTQPPPPQEC